MLKNVAVDAYEKVRAFVKDNIVAFFKENGFTSVILLVLAFALPLIGHGKLGLVLLGVFIGVNMQIIKQLWNNSDVKKQLSDEVDKVKDKFNK